MAEYVTSYMISFITYLLMHKNAARRHFAACTGRKGDNQ